MRVAIDSNVLVAAFATHGLCHSLLEICLSNHQIIVSEDVLEEVSVALQQKIKLPPSVVKDVIAYLRKQSKLESPVPVPPDACRDPRDLKVLGLAVASKADCIVSGDKDLLVLKNFQGIDILSPRDFWQTLQISGH